MEGKTVELIEENVPVVVDEKPKKLSYYQRNKDRLKAKSNHYYHTVVKKNAVPKVNKTDSPTYYKEYYEQNKEYLKKRAKERYQAKKAATKDSDMQTNLVST